MRHRFLIIAAAALPACASAPPAVAPAPPSSNVLGYAETAPTTATYVFTDSSGFNIQGGAVGNITATIGTAGTATVAYAQRAGTLEATITVTDLAGAMTNSAMGGGPTATEADITGAAVVTLTPVGATNITAMPTFSKAAEGVGMSRSFYRRFFIRLPARAVQPGATWVDTLRVTDEAGGSKADVVDIQTSTFVRDTVVNGRTLALITTTADRTLKIAGVNEGVEIKQSLTGKSTGRLLWDTQRRILYERVETSELSGTFDLPQMGMTGLPVTARSNNRVTLR
jgi:hypothetical protein